MKYLSIYILCFFLFPAVVLSKADLRKDDLIKSGYLTKQDTLIMRGIAAIAIMIAHYVLHGMSEPFNITGPIVIYKWAGGIGVCIFFFCSGYGLYLSIINNGAEHFLWKRFKGILPTFWILRLLSAFILQEYKSGFGNFTLYVVGIKKQAWFITEILIIYVLFYISYKISISKQILFMTVLLVFMSILFWKIGLDPRWYNANLTFVLGMVLAKYREHFINKTINHFWIILLILLFSLGGVGIVFIKCNVDAVRNLIKLPAEGIICILICLFLLKIRLSSPLILFCGQYSLELYIIHLAMWKIPEHLQLGWDYTTMFWISTLTSILCIVIFSLIKQQIQKLIRRYMNEEHRQ